MSNPGLSEETLAEAAALFREHGGSTAAAARAAGVPRCTMQNRINRAAERGMLGTDPVMPGFRVAKVSTTEEDGEIVRRHVQQLPERGDAFAVPAGHVVKGVSALVDPSGNEIIKWVKTREGGAPVDIIAACKAAMEGYSPAALPAQAPVLASGNLLTLFPANDWHLGMHAWGRETEENWDLKIAEARIGAAAVEAIERSPPSVEAVLLGGGDLMHSDNNSNTTARSGNALQVDGRYQKIVEVACRLKVRVTDAMLGRHGRVIVRILPGNHDEHAAVAIAYFLAAWYRNEPRVTVDLDPSLFWWHRFGKVLLGATHGHTVKIQAMPGIMAHRRAEDWGLTRYRFCHGFHLHHSAKFATEGDGVISEIHQAPIPQDAWHFGAGFLSGRSLQTITYHHDFGEVSRSRVAILDA